MIFSLDASKLKICRGMLSDRTAKASHPCFIYSLNRFFAASTSLILFVFQVNTTNGDVSSRISIGNVVTSRQTTAIKHVSASIYLYINLRSYRL